MKVFSTKRACRCAAPATRAGPAHVQLRSKHGWCPCVGTGLALTRQRKNDDSKRDDDTGAQAGFPSEDQGRGPGRRPAGLRRHAAEPASRGVRFDDQGITRSRLGWAGRAWIESLHLDGRDADIARRGVTGSQPPRLPEVGLGYRRWTARATLSGGGRSASALAAQLGSNLQGVCYVLDRPTIGLHPRDNRSCSMRWRAGRQRGNTLVVVEHDEDTIRRADHHRHRPRRRQARRPRLATRRRRRTWRARGRSPAASGANPLHPLQARAAWWRLGGAAAAVRRRLAGNLKRWTWPCR